MAKIIPTILLNDLQIATLDELKAYADPDGMIRGEAVAYYKQNVIGALLRHGAIKVFREKHFKLCNVTIERRLPHVKRTPKVAQVASDNSDAQPAMAA